MDQIDESVKPRQRYQMVALDLDNTLLNSDHILSDATKEYLRRLSNKGFTIILATGRHISTLEQHVADLNLQTPIPVVSSNGGQGMLCTCVSKEKDGEEVREVQSQVLFSTPIPELVARRTIQFAKELGFVSQYYVGSEVLADPREPHHFEKTELYMNFTGAKTRYLGDQLESVALQKGLPSKILVLCRCEEQDGMIESFRKELEKDMYRIDGKPATIVRGGAGWFLEVLPPNVNKGIGLKRMCSEFLNIEREHCIAFGDGDNDYEFIAMAGRGIVMKNGLEGVKAIADEVIPYTNDEDGVIRTLETMDEQGLLEYRL